MEEKQLWSINLSNRTAVHKCGAVITFEDGVIMDVDVIPKSFSSTDIRNLLRGARCAYAFELKNNTVTNNQTVTARPVLRLKR